MVNSTFAIIAPVYLEHNYINFFIEYHIDLGFNKIYIMIDDSTDIQEEYEIFEELLPFVKIFKYSDFYTQEETDIFMKQCGHKSIVVHKPLIEKIYPLVSEEYIILLGLDSFLYLENMKLLEYFQKYNIKDDVAQICFRWSCLYNYSYKSEYNILNSVNNEKSIIDNFNSRMHYFTLGKKSLVAHPTYDSHHYKLNETKKLFFNGNIIDITPEDNFYNIVDKIKGFNFEQGDSCILHILQRNFQDSLIKKLYCWSKQNINPYEITRQIIKKKESPGRWRIHPGVQKKNFFDIKYNASHITELKYTFNENLINKLISDSGVSINEFDEWISLFTDKN